MEKNVFHESVCRVVEIIRTFKFLLFFSQNIKFSAEFVTLICRETRLETGFEMKQYFLAVEWCTSHNLFICSRYDKVPRVCARCLMAPDITAALLQWWVGVEGRGTYQTPPHFCTHRWAVWSHCASVQKRSTPQPQSYSPRKHTLQHPSSPPLPSLWNRITCVLFFNWWVYSIRWDRMEDVEEE